MVNPSGRQNSTPVNQDFAEQQEDLLYLVDLDDDDLETGDLGEGGASGDVPQEFTQSYGTGVQELPGFVEGGRSMRNRLNQFNEATPELTGGDVDANYEQANAVGDEAVGGTAPTPDMDVVDELGRAVGLEMNDFNYLYANEILEQRDDRRWELEPMSSEDYIERQDEE